MAIRTPIKFLLLCATSILGCTTIHQNTEDEKREAQVLQTQKSLIVSFLNRGLAAMAQKELRKILTTHPKDPDLHNLMGLSMLALKSPLEAAGRFRHSMSLDNQIPYALNLSSALLEAKKYHQALKELQQIRSRSDFDRYPHPERVFHNVGLAFERQAKPVRAIKQYRLALAQNPNFYISHMRLGELYQSRRRFKSAAGHFRRATKLCKVCYDPVRGLSRSLLALNKKNQAVRALTSFLKEKGLGNSERAEARKMLSMAQRFRTNN